MNVAIQTVTILDGNSGVTNVDISEQKNFRRQLIEELYKEVSEFPANASTDPLYMPAMDFLTESFQVLA